MSLETLAPERDALWKRLEAASFLTADERLEEFSKFMKQLDARPETI